MKKLKKRKLKGFVLPTLYMLITISIFTSIIFLGSSVNLKNKNYDYGINALKENVKLSEKYSGKIKWHCDIKKCEGYPKN